jgi:hypothetical protein
LTNLFPQIRIKDTAFCMKVLMGLETHFSICHVAKSYQHVLTTTNLVGIIW